MCTYAIYSTFVSKIIVLLTAFKIHNNNANNKRSFVFKKFFFNKNKNKTKKKKWSKAGKLINEQVRKGMIWHWHDDLVGKPSGNQ